MIRCSFCNKW